MKKGLRGLIVVLAVALCSVSLFANGSQETVKESKELNIIYAGTPQIQEREYVLNSYYKDFEEEFGIKINVDFVPQADAIKVISTQQETGNIVADIIYADTANMAPYVNGGWMQDISSIVEKSGVSYTQMFDETTNKDSERYFLPNSFDVYILIANTKALKYLPEGLTQTDVETGLSWEQYAQWAVNIAAGEGSGKTMLPTSKTGSQLLYPMGGMTLSYGGEFPEFNTEAAKEAFSIIATIAAGNGFYSQQAQYSAVTDPMLSGDVWLAFSHMAPAGTAYNAAPNSFVIGAAPHGDAGVGSTSGAWCYGIQKGAPHQDAAEKFISYITRPEVNYDFCFNYGALSPIYEVEELMSDEDVIMKAGSNILETAIVSGVPSTQFSDWNAVKLLFCDIMDEIETTKAVPTDAYLDTKQAALDVLRK